MTKLDAPRPKCQGVFALMTASIAVMSCERTGSPVQPQASATKYDVQMLLVFDEPTDETRRVTLELHDEAVDVALDPCLTGEDLLSVQMETNDTGRPILVLRFTEAGAQRLARITADNTHRRLAIVVGNRALMAPRIEDKVEDGVLQLSGGFTRAELESLRNAMRSNE